METVAEAGLPARRLLAPDEPGPCETVNGSGRRPVLLLCDHASAFIPRALGSLGLDEMQLGRHIALDIGAGEVTRLLAEHLDAPALLAGFSRLVVDPNRTLDAPSLIPEVSDGVEIPGNRNLLPAAREARIETFHGPYHATIAERLDSMVARAGSNDALAVISIHSMTPVLDGVERPWQVSVLWNLDPRLPEPLMARLRDAGLIVGNNQPYTGRDAHGHTLHSQVEPRGIPNALIEIRQDLIDTRHGVREWAGVLGAALDEVLRELLPDGTGQDRRNGDGRIVEEGPVEGGRL